MPVSEFFDAHAPHNNKTLKVRSDTVNPVFIRRGNVLFLLKSPADFIKGLQNGKFRPTDCLLVKDSGTIEWIPIEEIQQFRLGSDPFNTSIPDDFVLHSQDLFDHIRQPRFNLSALTLGGFWYFMHGMPRIAVTRLILTVLLMASVGSIGMLIQLSFSQLLPLILMGWISMGIFNAFRADHDLNLLQMTRFHQDQSEPDVDSVELDVMPVLDDDSPDLQILTPKDKILN